MKRLLIPLIVLGLVCCRSSAQTPQPEKKPVSPQVFLLDNFQILTATGERTGDVYRLSVGKEVREIPVKRILFVGESHDAVRRFMMSRGKPHSQPEAEPRKNSLSTEAFAHFTAKVQPILMNTCARCHCDSKVKTSFQLERTPLGYADPGTSRRNAITTAPFVWNVKSSSSPLLDFATSAHGGERNAPLPSRSHPAVRNLARFVQLVGIPPVEQASATSPTAPLAQAVVQAAAVSPTLSRMPVVKPRKDDPFDPDVFNQKFR